MWWRRRHRPRSKHGVIRRVTYFVAYPADFAVKTHVMPNVTSADAYVLGICQNQPRTRRALIRTEDEGETGG